MIIDELKLYDILRESIGTTSAEAFLQLMETKVENKISQRTEVFATKEDVFNLRQEMVKEFAVVRNEISGVRLEVSSIREEISHMEARLIKWTIGTMVASGGLFGVMAKWL